MLARRYPRERHLRPVGGCSLRPALRIFFILLSFLPPTRTGGKARKDPIPYCGFLGRSPLQAA
jgi:hypothetical protein